MIVIFRRNSSTRFQLDPMKQYEFCIHDFYCLFPRSVTKLLTHGTFLALESNLVAKSSLNPCQSIMFFEFDANKIWQSVKPSFQCFDSLTLKDLEYASFNVSTLKEQIPVSQLICKLEIRELAQ